MEEGFYTYRKEKDYSEKTIRSQDCYIRKFNAWLMTNSISLQEVGYQTLLSFVSDERKKGIASANLRNHLQAIRIYLSYQKETGTIDENPAIGIHLKDKYHRIPLPAIPEETLGDMYKAFAQNQPEDPIRKLQHQRDTVALGMVIFQGLDSGDLERLTVKDINLREGTLYIASSRKNASRTLNLEALQILQLSEYITQTRPQLNPNHTDNNRFFTKSKIQDMVSAIVKKLKHAYPIIQDPRHIRSSVIQNWLKINHIRQVQYMAGHKRISSTERYRREDLDDLIHQLQKYHPVK